MILNVHENNESISNLDVILRAEARDDGSGDFKVPLVTHMAKVFISHMIILVGALRNLIQLVKAYNVCFVLISHLITDPEFGDESWIVCTLLVECRLI
jgi:hypothetical protein